MNRSFVSCPSDSIHNAFAETRPTAWETVSTPAPCERTPCVVLGFRAKAPKREPGSLLAADRPHYMAAS